jgi:hypothetical protein
MLRTYVRSPLRKLAQMLAERYLRLGLQVGLHVDGIVDAYFGPPELAAEVEAVPPVEPTALVASADALLDELDDGWLRDQVAGLRTYAAGLGGEPLSYADEVEGCYGVRPTHTDESAFAAAHEELEELLPGDGSLAERYAAWRNSMLVPAERVEGAVAAVMEEARSWTNELVELPAEEGIELAAVHDEPWLAFNHYLGDLKSRVEINVGLPISALDLLHLAIHETYPGHHAELALKEHHLVRGGGLLEHTIVLVPTPQSLVSEGIAELAVDLVLDAVPGLSSAVPVEFDLAHALAVEHAHEPCRWAAVNAALMLHEHGATEAETQAYLERWGLMPPELAAHLVRFATEPTSRTYVLTYSAGRELCRDYVAAERTRFKRLLTDQVRVGELRRGRLG